MSDFFEWIIEGKKAKELGIPQVKVYDRKNGRKWKYKLEVDSIWAKDSETNKDKISQEAQKRIYEKAKEIDEETQVPASISDYQYRDETYEMYKEMHKLIIVFCLRKKEDAVELGEFIAEIIENEFKVEVDA